MIISYGSGDVFQVILQAFMPVSGNRQEEINADVYAFD